MAIIGKIREKSILILVIVGLSLVLFILGDSLTNPSSGPTNVGIGEVHGEPVDEREYTLRIESALTQLESEYAQEGRPVTEIDKDNKRQEVWDRLTTDIVIDHEVEKLPIVVTADELNDLVYGVNIHPFIKGVSRFYDPTGVFSVDSVSNFLRQVELNDELKTQWLEFEKQIKHSRKQIKYATLASKGTYVTSLEAKRDYEEANRIYKVRFVVKKYFDIIDSTITVTDEEIRAFYEKNKFRKQYELPGSRSIEYIEFPLAAAASDSIRIQEDLKKLIKPFKESKNDSLFVMQHAENKYFSDRYASPSEFPASIDSLIQNADSGDVIGPYEQYGFYRIAKIRGIDKETQKQVRVRHILLGKAKGDMATLKQRADSLKTVIKANKNFAAMVTLFTDDPASIPNGGVYEWFPEGQMVTAFNDACFNGKVGDMPIVETEYGVHLIEILGKRDGKKVKYAAVDTKIMAGEETEEIARGAAMEFVENLSDPSKFAEEAQKKKFNLLEYEIVANQLTIENNEGTRDLVRWARSAIEGDLSSDIKVGEKIVVAHLVTVKEKGVPEFEDIKEVMEIPTREEKKAAMLIEQMKGTKTIEEAAQRVNANVIDGEFNFGSTTIIGGGGNEPEVIGTVFSLTAAQKGALTVPIKGKVGVYVVQLIDVVEPAEGVDYSPNKLNKTTTLRSRAERSMIEALREKAQIIDNRQF